MKKKSVNNHFAGMLEDVAFISSITGDKPKAKALRQIAKKVRKAGSLLCFHDLDEPSSRGGRTLCNKSIAVVRWTTGWRVSGNPPYKERREKTTCPACLKKLAKRGLNAYGTYAK